MIEAALWILSFIVVIVFVVLLAFGGIAVLSTATGRNIIGGIVIVVLVVVAWTYQQAIERQKQNSIQSQNNAPLQSQCILEANTEANRLAQDAMNRWEYTQDYKNRLAVALQASTNRCRSDYPTY